LKVRFLPRSPNLFNGLQPKIGMDVATDYYKRIAVEALHPPLRKDIEKLADVHRPTQRSRCRLRMGGCAPEQTRPTATRKLNAGCSRFVKRHLPALRSAQLQSQVLRIVAIFQSPVARNLTLRGLLRPSRLQRLSFWQFGMRDEASQDLVLQLGKPLHAPPSAYEWNQSSCLLRQTFTLRPKAPSV